MRGDSMSIEHRKLHDSANTEIATYICIVRHQIMWLRLCDQSHYFNSRCELFFLSFVVNAIHFKCFMSLIRMYILYIVVDNSFSVLWILNGFFFLLPVAGNIKCSWVSTYVILNSLTKFNWTWIRWVDSNCLHSYNHKNEWMNEWRVRWNCRL